MKVVGDALWNEAKRYGSDTAALVVAPFHWDATGRPAGGGRGGGDRRRFRRGPCGLRRVREEPVGLHQRRLERHDLVRRRRRRSRSPRAHRGCGLVSGNDDVRDMGRDALEASIIAGFFTNVVIKPAAGRWRPSESNGETIFEPFSGHTSFTSGHATQAFAVASVIAMRRPAGSSRRSPTAWRTVVACDRINDRAHFASDVVTGALFATATGRFLVHRHRQETGGIDPEPAEDDRRGRADRRRRGAAARAGRRRGRPSPQALAGQVGGEVEDGHVADDASDRLEESPPARKAPAAGRRGVRGDGEQPRRALDRQADAALRQASRRRSGERKIEAKSSRHEHLSRIAAVPRRASSSVSAPSKRRARRPRPEDAPATRAPPRAAPARATISSVPARRHSDGEDDAVRDARGGEGAPPEGSVEQDETGALGLEGVGGGGGLGRRRRSHHLDFARRPRHGRRATGPNRVGNGRVRTSGRPRWTPRRTSSRAEASELAGPQAEAGLRLSGQRVEVLAVACRPRSRPPATPLTVELGAASATSAVVLPAFLARPRNATRRRAGREQHAREAARPPPLTGSGRPRDRAKTEASRACRRRRPSAVSAWPGT